MAVSLYDLQGVIELMQSLKLQFLQIHEQNSKRFRELHNAHPPNYKPHGVLISLSNIDSTWIGTFFCYCNDYLPTCLNLVVMYIYIIAFIFLCCYLRFPSLLIYVPNFFFPTENSSKWVQPTKYFFKTFKFSRSVSKA